MARDITWDGGQTKFLGRNGSGWCAGLFFLFVRKNGAGVPSVTLRPVTSRGLLARCQIEVPMSAVPEFVSALEAVHADSVTGKES
jgi:hypothetical protein